MSILPPSVDYTTKDFDALRARLIRLVQSVFPDWTDFEVAGFGNILIEMYAFVGDVLTFYQDNLARESRLVTATQRKNVMALAHMLGFKLEGARAATAEVAFGLQRARQAGVTIPKGTIIRTREVTEPVQFQLLQDVVIESGQVTATGLAEHSESHTRLDDTRGQMNLAIVLDRVPYLDQSAEVSTPLGDYTEVRSFLSSGPNDRHFVVRIDQDDRATVQFGDGRSGLPPRGTVRARYKTGGGARGNLDANRLVVVEGLVRDAHGQMVQVTATNPHPATGGVDRQSLASARALAPESLRAMTRSVAREDFEINARRLPAVARALMLTSNEDPGIDENAGHLYIVPQGGGPPTESLKNLVLKQVTEVYPCTLTFQVSVLDAVYRPIHVQAEIYLKPGFAPEAVRARIMENLRAYFRLNEPNGLPNSRVDFGFNVRDADGQPIGEIAWSDIFNVVRDTQGVRKIGTAPSGFTLNGRSEDVRLEVEAFPVLGRVTLVHGDTGAPL